MAFVPVSHGEFLFRILVAQVNISHRGIDVTVPNDALDDKRIVNSLSQQCVQKGKTYKIRY